MWLAATRVYGCTHFGFGVLQDAKVNILPLTFYLHGLFPVVVGWHCGVGAWCIAPLLSGLHGVWDGVVCRDSPGFLRAGLNLNFDFWARVID